ncbi:ATP-dependent zinc metalloprotease FtsH [Methylocystis hirsuta]|uniref:ATP-dependent zinc metalloprotease FtsH n=5 Tax=Methylocystis TaxID=133 RepID=A0A3M9XVC3_9HYPH|nr:ATP-dependent zinc metalloprotease FtsH [Methylocystis hirsuta]RNJ51815.1 ATP-dependent metallopeptidase FtsH/Yme1/Tma family protein [Methylocystis hirsuta]
MKANWKKYLPWVLFVAVGALLFGLFQHQQTRTPAREITFSELLVQIDEGRVHDVTMSGNEISGHFNDNRSFTTYAPSDPGLVQKLESKKVQISAKPANDSPGWLSTLLVNGLPLLLFIAVWIYMARQMQGGAGGRAMGFGKSKAKLLTETQGRVTFEDVAGVDEAKEDLQEIVEFLRDPQKFQRLGGRIPRGVLLVGPPGTGKTLLARAIAGEAGVPFFSISGSDFVEMFVGVGASRVRDMFEQAKKNAPCIIFVDEIDAVGRHRGAGLGGGNDEREQTLNQLLVEMDGFEANEGIILIAATNRPDVLDPALMRPGRFDRQIQVPNPDFIGREKILKVHARKVPLAPDVDLKIVARGTPGFSGADLMNLVNEAALLAARRSKRIVTKQEFEDARDKIMMGAERRTLVMTDEEKKLTAYHEGGHALVQLSVPGAMPIHKATIIPRGRALGMVQGLPERDQISQTYEQLTAMLAIAMGGRVAEEMIFGHDKVTSGAASDIQQCTRVARAMVTQLGFSNKLGTVAYANPEQEQFLGYSLGRQQTISEATQQTIDAEVRRLVQEAYDEAMRILTEKRSQLDTLANALLEFETLSGDEMKGLLVGKRPVREESSPTQPPRGSAVPTTGQKPEPDVGGLEPQPV